MSDERPLNEYIDLEAYDVVPGEKYRSLAVELRHSVEDVGAMTRKNLSLIAELERVKRREQDGAAHMARQLLDLEAEVERVKAERDEFVVITNGLRHSLDKARKALQAFFTEWDGNVGTYAPTDDTEALMRDALKETE